MTLKRKPKTIKEQFIEAGVHTFQYSVFLVLALVWFFSWYSVRAIFTVMALIPMLAGIAFVIIPPTIVGTVDPAITEPVRYVSIIIGFLLILYALYELWNIWYRSHYDVLFMSDEEQIKVLDKIRSNKTRLARKAGLEPYYGKDILMPDEGESVEGDNAFDRLEAATGDSDFDEIFGDDIFDEVKHANY